MSKKFKMVAGKLVKIKVKDASVPAKTSRAICSKATPPATAIKATKKAATKKAKPSLKVLPVSEDGSLAIQTSEHTRFLVSKALNDKNESIVSCAKQYNTKKDPEWKFARGGFQLPSMDVAEQFASALLTLATSKD